MLLSQEKYSHFQYCGYEKLFSLKGAKLQKLPHKIGSTHNLFTEHINCVTPEGVIINSNTHANPDQRQIRTNSEPCQKGALGTRSPPPPGHPAGALALGHVPQPLGESVSGTSPRQCISKGKRQVEVRGHLVRGGGKRQAQGVAGDGQEDGTDGEGVTFPQDPT